MSQIKECCIPQLWKQWDDEQVDEWTCENCGLTWWKRHILEITDPRTLKSQIVPGENNRMSIHAVIRGSVTKQYEIWTDEPWVDEEEE